MTSNDINALSRRYWRDISSFASIFLLTSISIYKDYESGMLAGFLILFVFFSYERVKRIIVELNIKKIYGVEFGEKERNAIVDEVKSELDAKGAFLDDSVIENIADIALNQVHGVAYKSRYYEEMVGYALKDLNLAGQQRVSGVIGKSPFSFDYLVEIDDARVVGIEAVYSDQRYLDESKLERIRKSFETASKAEHFAGFVVITNAEVRNADMAIFSSTTPPITLIEKTISPDGVLSKLTEYFKKVRQE